MCIILKDKPLEEQIQNTGILNKIVFKVVGRSELLNCLKTPFRNVPVIIGEKLKSDKKLTSYEFYDNKLYGGVTSLMGLEECLRLITIYGLGTLGANPHYNKYEIVILSGLIPSNTPYVEGDFEYIGHGYCSEAFLPISEFVTFTNTIEGRTKFFNMIKNLDDWNKSLMYKK